MHYVDVQEFKKLKDITYGGSFKKMLSMKRTQWLTI